MHCKENNMSVNVYAQLSCQRANSFFSSSSLVYVCLSNTTECNFKFILDPLTHITRPSIVFVLNFRD